MRPIKQLYCRLLRYPCSPPDPQKPSPSSYTQCCACRLRYHCSILHWLHWNIACSVLITKKLIKILQQAAIIYNYLLLQENRKKTASRLMQAIWWGSDPRNIECSWPIITVFQRTDTRTWCTSKGMKINGQMSGELLDAISQFGIVSGYVHLTGLIKKL